MAKPRLRLNEAVEKTAETQLQLWLTQQLPKRGIRVLNGLAASAVAPVLSEPVEGEVDLTLPDYYVALELWNGRSGHRFTKGGLLREARWERDLAKTKALSRAGYWVFWVDETRYRSGKARARLLDALTQICGWRRFDPWLDLEIDRF
jgi:hypothetical protein